MPATGVLVPEREVMSHAASASFSVAVTMLSVAAGDTRRGRAGSTGRAGTGATRGCERGQSGGGTPPVIQGGTPATAHPEKSPVTGRGPTPRTTSRLPRGKRP